MKKLCLILMMFISMGLLVGCDNSDRDVSISLPSGTYYGEMHVTLSCADPTAQITYTLDGSDPGESNLVYDPEVGISVNYTSDLKATAGSNVAEAHYDIIPYTATKEPAAAAFFNAAQGTYSTDASRVDNFTLKNSNVIIQEPGQPEVTSGYLLKDVNGNNATLVYTNSQGQNVETPISYNPETHQITFNGKVYTLDWYLEDISEE